MPAPAQYTESELARVLRRGSTPPQEDERRAPANAPDSKMTSTIRSRDPGAFDATLVAPTLATASAHAAPHSRPTSLAPEQWVGAHLDHYVIERPLGRGGMGAVFVGRDLSLDRAVAIKVLPEAPPGVAGLEERFIREARAQARLNSPNVVHIYHIGFAPGPEGPNGYLYFAMELVDGEPLESLIAEPSAPSALNAPKSAPTIPDGAEGDASCGVGARDALQAAKARLRRAPPAARGLEPERARRYMIDVARGLRDAHRAGVIHRDIKPSNLLCDRNGSVKIADFGVAKPLDGNVSITQEGFVLGTPLYMAPEQARGEPVDHRADMYSLGCTFYHLLAGTPPFDGPTPIAVVAKHLTQPLEPLRGAAPHVPPRLATIVERLLAKDADARFATYDDLLDALDAAAPKTVAYVGFWPRAVTVAIDCILAGLLIAVLGWPGLVVHLAYVTLAHAYRGQTLAKYLMGIEVRRPDGRRVGILRSVVRTVVAMWLPFLVGVVMLVSKGTAHLRSVVEHMQPRDVAALESLVIAIAIGHVFVTLLWIGGLALAAFHPRKRALHDLLVDTDVVYRLKK